MKPLLLDSRRHYRHTFEPIARPDIPLGQDLPNGHPLGLDPDAVRGRRFMLSNQGYASFAAYGPGAFRWEQDPAAQDADGLLTVQTPGGLLVKVRCRNEGHQGGRDERGVWWSWDGNGDAPQILPALQAGDWSGFMDRGFLSKCPPRPDRIDSQRRSRHHNTAALASPFFR